MSETVQTPTAPCDSLIDYAYDELTGPEAEAFKAHLAGCDKCQVELKAMQRVRGAVKAAMPMVEPPVAATGGLHAQLLHAAAQRRPPAVQRGKVLSFFRKVATHPAYAAAAMFAIVATAAGVQWSRGKLLMPAPEAAPAVTATGTTAEPATPAAVPVAAAEAPEPAAGAGGQALALDPAKEATNSDDLTQDDLTQKVRAPARPTTKLAPPKAAAYKGDLDKAMPSKDEATRYFSDTKTNKPADGLFNDGANMRGQPGAGYAMPAAKKTAPKRDESNLSGLESAGDQAIYGGKVSGGEGSGGTLGGVGTRRRAGSSSTPGSWNGNVTDAPAGRGAPAPASTAPVAAPAAPPPPAEKPAAVKSEEVPRELLDGRMQQQQQGPSSGTIKGGKQSLSQPNAPSQQQAFSRTADAMRKKAEELANSGRCDDAVKLYKQLETTYPSYRIGPVERMPFVRCLRITGKLQDAENELDAVRRDKAPLNTAIDQEERLQKAQRKSPAKPAPQRVAEPSQRNEESQKAATKAKRKAADDAYQAPVQAAPPPAEAKPADKAAY